MAAKTNNVPPPTAGMVPVPGAGEHKEGERS